MNRRSFLARVGPVAVTLPFVEAANTVLARTRVTPLDVTKIDGRTFIVTGGGGNVTVFDSNEGVLLVDGGSPERSGEVLRLVKKLTGTSKIHTLFNTHWHWDQTGANLTLGRSGTRIIAHENTKLWLSTDVDSKWEHRAYPRLPVAARPNQTFYQTGRLAFGGITIDYGYLPQAHTDGDIYVFLRDTNVLVAGGVLSIGAYPIIDYCTNGWIGGMLAASETLLGLGDASTQLVPASGAIMHRADLETEHAMLAAMKVKLAQLLAQGMSAQDMLAAAPTRDFDAQWGDPNLFIQNAWPGLVNRARELGVTIV